jgi:hypothetical protein
MELKIYYNSLDTAERKAYAARAKTDPEYIRIHLIPRSGCPDRMPRKELLRALAEASNGSVSFEEVLKHFFECKEEVA